ncbi:hypothetical protein GALL_531850 [mine drainage metagenome]|uniref:Uncharacterized protein n=1 Tax=mine drainage metagenome TaxID=410659 RepID=A0A1J5P2G7_9ZZZZ
MPGQFLVERQLDAFLSLVFNIGKAHDVGRCLAIGVLTLVFLALVNPLDFQSLNLRRHRLIDLAFEPDKAFVFLLEFFAQLGT